VPHPALLLGFAEGVQVEDELPFRRGLAVFVEAGPPPQAPGILRVLPEVVVEVAGLRDVGDLGLGIEDLEDVGFQFLVGRPGFQFLGGLGVALPHPGQGLLAGHVLEPQVGVGGGGLGGRLCHQGSSKEQDQR
jgi:hypothetical protein